VETLSCEILIAFILVGFLAQMIDGALGMAYGVTSTSILLSVGVSPVAASASVHTAEIFTSGASGISHLKLQNIDFMLFKKLLLPGVIGGVLGAYILSSIPGKTIKPFIAIYLLLMGLKIIFKSQNHTLKKQSTAITPLALTGGFCDAIGGGGWGPVVTSTLVAKGNNPQTTIGSVNLTEFFVTISEVITFIMVIKLIYWEIILGLIIGGVIAAPLAAYTCKKIPSKKLMLMVGVLIIVLSLRTIYLSI